MQYTHLCKGVFLKLLLFIVHHCINDIRFNYCNFVSNNASSAAYFSSSKLSWVMWSEVKVAQSCPTLSNHMDCSLPGSSVHGILQARILEWVDVPFSRWSSQHRDWTQVSPLQVDSLPSEPPRKPKNTEVGSHSLLRGTSQPRN